MKKQLLPKPTALPVVRKWKRFVDTPAVPRDSINTETVSPEGKTQRLKRAAI